VERGVEVCRVVVGRHCCCFGLLSSLFDTVSDGPVSLYGSFVDV